MSFSDHHLNTLNDEVIETIKRDDQNNLNDGVFNNLSPSYNQLTTFNPRLNIKNSLPPLQPLSESVLTTQLNPLQLKDAGLSNSSNPIKKNSKKKKESTTKTRPAFVIKLWNMVNDKSNEKYIKWMPNGKSFQVCNREEFMKFILPKYFKHNNFASFVRQLNMYGWHKVQDINSGSLQNNNDEVWQFESPFFQKNREDLLDLIVRNKSNSNNDDEEIDFNLLLNELETIKLNQYAITEDLRRVRKDNETLWKENFLTRERHKTQAETLDKILHFLATVYGNNSSKILGLESSNDYNLTSLNPYSNNNNTNNNTASNISSTNNNNNGIHQESYFPPSPYRPMLMLTNKSHRGSNSVSNPNLDDFSNIEESPIQEIIDRDNSISSSKLTNDYLNNLNNGTTSISSPRILFPELSTNDFTPEISMNTPSNTSNTSNTSNSSNNLGKTDNNGYTDQENLIAMTKAHQVTDPIMDGLEENILKQGESIQQVQDWINKLHPKFSNPNPSSKLSTDEFDVNEFLNPNTPVFDDDDQPPSKRVHEIEELPTKKLRGSDDI